MKNTKIKNLIYLFLIPCVFHIGLVRAQGKDGLPNIIIIFTDDMGYGDLGIFGNPTIYTPNLDRMAYEGQKWTNFYVAAPVCTPSRAGLMTGRLPVRSGMASNKKRVLFPNSRGGLPPSEISIAKFLKGAGYATGMIGKWHLGHLKEYMPNAHGFDYYYGIPYSNDMDPVGGISYVDALRNPKIDYFNVPLVRNGIEVERPADQNNLTKKYTEEAVGFIDKNKNKPFFLYLAHAMPHVPLFASTEFKGKSRSGIYGDVIEELDWSVGKVLEALKRNGIDEKTLVVFTSDNGPWLIFDEYGGSPGALKGGKGGTYEGGMRVPAIFRWPGKLKQGVVMEMGSTLDLFPTIAGLIHRDMPNDRVYDGYDLKEVMFNQSKSPRSEILYYRDTEVYAIRKGGLKVHFVTQDEYGNEDMTIHHPALVYNLDVDPGEKKNVSKKHPDFIIEMKKRLEEHKATVSPVVNQLEL
ncbi:arylsulfatase [Sphingobacterium sp. CZ-UAM]|uniref:sulfatase family protein n=1 Tax=Sphingobacterium sp. CZ-UAM TaxID=1933868 RepID=UPI0009852D4F|nr:sulfatase [Sphingobacterium sp. CZ-UAM]OOG19689.1 arylsulfatase [Sphingobacterium sp. CZ-UAM]